MFTIRVEYRLRNAFQSLSLVVANNMGHIRLGRLPRSKKWRDIVHLLTVASTTADIAAATLEASKAGLESARHDTALVHSFWSSDSVTALLHVSRTI